MTLLDKDAGMVDGLGQPKLVDTGLETTLQEILDLQSQHVIELHAGLVKHTDTDKTANQSVSFEKALGVFLVKGEKFTVISLRVSYNSHFRLTAGIHTEQHDESWTR